MSKLNSMTCLISAGFPLWYAYGVSRGVVTTFGISTGGNASEAELGLLTTDNDLLTINPNETTLDLSGCVQITDEGLKHIAKLENLTELDLSECDKITDEGLKHIATLKNLKELDLSECDKITDEGLKHIATLKNLTKLDLSGCHKITNKGLESLANMTTLTELTLRIQRVQSSVIDADVDKLETAGITVTILYE